MAAISISESSSARILKTSQQVSVICCESWVPWRKRLKRSAGKARLLFLLKSIFRLTLLSPVLRDAFACAYHRNAHTPTHTRIEAHASNVSESSTQGLCPQGCRREGSRRMERKEARAALVNKRPLLLSSSYENVTDQSEDGTGARDRTHSESGWKKVLSSVFRVSLATKIIKKTKLCCKSSANAAMGCRKPTNSTNVRLLFNRVWFQEARLFASINRTCHAVYPGEGLHQ